MYPSAGDPLHQPSRGSQLPLYVLFAVISTAFNIGTQALVYQISPVEPLAVSLLAGTIAGFGLKYLLDKFFVFRDPVRQASHEAGKVMLYGIFSVFTTLIFWGFELVFEFLWQTSVARYTGAAIGLAIGYALKFELDRRFVFGVRGAER